MHGAGAFEENSDVVCFLYRPAYYVERSTAYREGQPSALDEFEANLKSSEQTYNASDEQQSSTFSKLSGRLG